SSSAVRMVDLVADQLVPAPAGAGCVGWVWVDPFEGGPPFGFQPGLEVARIGRADDIAADRCAVLDDKHALRAEPGIGCDIDMTEQLRVPVERGRVLAAGPGRQTDPV